MIWSGSTYWLFGTGVGWQMVGLWLKGADGAARPGRVVGKTLFSTVTLTSRTPTTHTLRILKEKEDNILSHTHQCATGRQFYKNGGGKKQCSDSFSILPNLFLRDYEFQSVVQARDFRAASLDLLWVYNSCWATVPLKIASHSSEGVEALVPKLLLWKITN